MSTLINDIRFGLRQLRKNPGFTFMAVLVLALSIGACTAVFSLVNGVLLSSLPVPNPHELRVIKWSASEAENTGMGVERHTPKLTIGSSMSFPVFQSLRERCAEQADVFGYCTMWRDTARVQKEPFMTYGLIVSDNFFSGLGAIPLLGRLFRPGDTSADDTRSVVITYLWWEQHFGLDPNVIGQSVILNKNNFTVVGVLPRDFPGVIPGVKIEYYVSMAAQPHMRPYWSRTRPDLWWVHLMARKKPGVSDTQLQTVFDVALANATEGFLKNPKTLISDGRAGPTHQRDRHRKPLLLLLGVTCMVILVASTNLAALLMARGAFRQHEFAVRAAIGAGRWRLFRQTLTESLLLSLVGGGFGIMLAFWGRDIISWLIAGPTGRFHYDTALDLKVLGFSLLLTISTALLSGSFPAFRAALVSPLSGLEGRASSVAYRLGIKRFLVIAQIALSLILLTGAGLYVRTLVNLVRIDPGFQIEKVLLFQLNPRKAGYGGDERTDFYERVLNSLETIPGVRSAALTHLALLGGEAGATGFVLPNHPDGTGSKAGAHFLTISEEFFSTMGIPLRLGRGFTEADTRNKPRVIVVNETFVKRYMPNEYPIGQILRSSDGELRRRIVGVCADTKYTDIKGEVPPTVYYSFRQRNTNSVFFAVRTVLPPLSVAGAVRRALAEIDPDVPVGEVTTQRRIRDKKIAHERVSAILCGSLSLLALLVSCIGLYALMAYSVAHRTSEIGIRMALGATARHITWSIHRQAMSMYAAGVVIGGLGALTLTYLIRSQLYGVESHDPFTLASATVFLLVVTFLAVWLPARRAARIDPMEALRDE